MIILTGSQDRQDIFEGLKDDELQIMTSRAKFESQLSVGDIGCGTRKVLPVTNFKIISRVVRAPASICQIWTNPVCTLWTYSLEPKRPFRWIFSVDQELVLPV